MASKTYGLHDGLGNNIVTSTQLYATFTGSNSNTYGYVTGANVDGWAYVNVVATRRADDQKLTRTKDSGKGPLVVPCNALFPVPRNVADGITAIDWEQPVWGEDGSTVVSTTMLGDGYVLVAFAALPYQWMYSDTGIPDDDYSWMPRLTNESMDSALSADTCARRDVYELQCTRNGSIVDTWHRLNKREVICLVAVDKLLLWRKRLDWTTDIAALANAVIEATSDKTQPLSSEVGQHIRDQHAIDLASGKMTDEYDYVIRYHYTDDVSREVDFDGEIDEIVSIVADKMQ